MARPISASKSTELETHTQDGQCTLRPTETEYRKVLTVMPYQRYEETGPSGFDISFGLLPDDAGFEEEHFKQIEAIRAASTDAADCPLGAEGTQNPGENRKILGDDELTEWKRIVREAVESCREKDPRLVVEINNDYQVPAGGDNPQDTFELELTQTLRDIESYDLMLVEREGREKGLKFYVTPVQVGWTDPDHVGWTDPDHVEAVSTMMKKDVSFQATADRSFGSTGFAYAGRMAEMLSRRIRNESQDTTVRRYPRVVSTHVASQFQGCLLP